MTLTLKNENPKRQKELNNLIDTVTSLREVNPMLGHRGCRLGIIYPEISEMQSQAVFEAACILKKEGLNPMPEVMIPLVSDVKEFINQKKIVDDTALSVFKKEGVKLIGRRSSQIIRIKIKNDPRLILKNPVHLRAKKGNSYTIKLKFLAKAQRTLRSFTVIRVRLACPYGHG